MTFKILRVMKLP